MAVRNVARGGGKAFKGEVQGLKELERKLKALLPENPAMRTDLYKMVGQAGEELRDRMRLNAQSAGWGSQSIYTKGSYGKRASYSGQDVIDAMFVSSKEAPGVNSRKRINALVGVGKRRSMVEWLAGHVSFFSPTPRTPRRVTEGKPVSMSFATMLEMGTTRMRARPAIGPAVAASKSNVISKLADGMNALLHKYAA